MLVIWPFDPFGSLHLEKEWILGFGVQVLSDCVPGMKQHESFCTASASQSLHDGAQDSSPDRYSVCVQKEKSMCVFSQKELGGWFVSTQ